MHENPITRPIAELSADLRVGKLASVDGMTIFVSGQIKKNAENTGIPGFPAWNVICGFFLSALGWSRSGPEEEVT